MINLSSLQYKRLQLIDSFNDGAYSILRYALYSLGIIGILLLVANATALVAVPTILLSVSLFVLSPFLLAVSVSFYVSYLKTHPSYQITPELKKRNILNNFDFDALAVILILARSKTWEQFWLALAKDTNRAEVIYRLGLTPAALASLKAAGISADEVGIIIQDAVTAAEGQLVNIYHVFKVLFEGPEIHDILENEKLTKKDIESLLLFYQGIDQSKNVKAGNRTGGFGKSWAVSYTTVVDALTTAISVEQVKQRFVLLPIFSRQKVVDEFAQAMLKAAGQNILLVGESGIGKTELFYHFAAKVLQYQTDSELDGKDIRVLDVPRLLSLGETPQELQQIMGNLFGELSKAGNIILFIDQIDMLLEPSGKLGTVDMGSLLQGYLQSANVIITGTVSTEKYLKLIKPSSILNNAFSVINVPEPDHSELLGIVLSHVRHIEARYSAFFLLESLVTMCSLADRYIKDQQSPERELHLMEEIAATTHTQKLVIVTDEVVTSVVEQKAQVPLQVNEQAKETLLNLEQQLHQRIIGQDFAIKEVSDALLRARAGLSTGNKPVGSFLFLGPTGVGKTETAKALAAIYFGSESKLIRLDMSEYADQTSLQKLLGTDAVNEPGSLTMAIQEAPSAVMLFDEIEKSSELVKNALLQLLDEGKITTNYGKVLDFSNTIVIATSNAGSDYIRTQIQSGGTVASFEKPLIDQLISQKIFLTEFLNRFDGVIVFTPLSQSEVKQVVVLQLKMLEDKLQQEKGIALELAPAVIEELATKGYDPVFGARALQRVIKNDLETAIAKEIISQNPQPGSKLTISSL